MHIERNSFTISKSVEAEAPKIISATFEDQYLADVKNENQWSVAAFSKVSAEFSVKNDEFVFMIGGQCFLIHEPLLSDTATIHYSARSLILEKSGKKLGTYHYNISFDRRAVGRSTLFFVSGSSPDLVRFDIDQISSIDFFQRRFVRP